MTQTPGRPRCYRCGGEMQEGFTNAVGLFGASRLVPRLVFVVQGKPTSANPVAAFQQGLQDVPQNEAYLLRGHRCRVCGTVELVATEPIDWEP